MSTTAEQLVAESGLSFEAVTYLEPLVLALHELVPSHAPAPSPALAALLAAPPRRAEPRTRRQLARLGSVVAALSSLAVTGVAAAANELPDPAQRLVAELSERFLPLPLQFPQPDAGATQIDPAPAPVLPGPTGAGSLPELAGTVDPSDDTSRSSEPRKTSSAEAPAPTDPSAAPTPRLEPTPTTPPTDAPTGPLPDSEPDPSPTGPPPSTEPSPSTDPRLGGPSGEPVPSPTASPEESPVEEPADEGPPDAAAGSSPTG